MIDNNLKTTYEEQDLTEKVGDYQLNEEKVMNNGILKLDWTSIKSAIVYGLLAAVAIFLVSVVEAIIKLGSIYGIDWKNVIDVASMSVLSLFVFVLSIVKNLLTTNLGNFLGITKVK